MRPSSFPRRRRGPRLARSPLLFWLAVLALALLTASVVARALGRAESLEAQYGPLRPVVVAARAVEAGTALGSADLDVRMVPSGSVADGAFRSTGEVRGHLVVVPLERGEAILADRVAPTGLSAVAALLPAGRRAVSVPTGSNSPALRRGDVVDLLAALDNEPAVAVAQDAAVLDVRSESATVAVTLGEADAVAYALSQGGVTVALTPGPRPGSGRTT